MCVSLSEQNRVCVCASSHTTEQGQGCSSHYQCNDGFCGIVGEPARPAVLDLVSPIMIGAQVLDLCSGSVTVVVSMDGGKEKVMERGRGGGGV